MKWKQWIALGVITASALSGAVMLTGCGELPEAEAPTILTEAAAAPEKPSQAVEQMPTRIRADLVDLEITETSPSYLKVRFQVLKDPETTETIRDGHVTLEKQSGNSWEALPRITKLPEDPEAAVSPAGKGYWYDRWTDFARSYGLLSPGVYRIHWNLLKDQDPVTFEFSILSRENPEEAQAVDRILSSINRLSRQETSHISCICSSVGNPDDCRQYLRNGEDRLHVVYQMEGGEPRPIQGSMVRDGTAFLLRHENINTNDSPIHGWEPTLILPPGIRPDGWMPSLDPLETVEFTQITPEKIACHTPLKTFDPDSPEPFRDTEYAFDSAGNLTAIRSCTVEYARNRHGDYDALKRFQDLEVLDSSSVPEVIRSQKEAAPRSFSWEEDKKSGKAEAVTFKNKEARPVSDAAQALDWAKNECTVKFDGTMVYRDAEAHMWKVEFQQDYGLTGYQYIYLNDQGVTQMISLAGPKEQWYPEE